MSFLFDKILPLSVYPLGLALILIASGIALNFVGRRRASILLLSFAVVELWAFSTPLVSRLLLTTLENTNSPILTKSADVAILLGGMIRGGHDAPDLTDAADRAVTAFRLFRKGQVKSILVSGGNLPWS